MERHGTMLFALEAARDYGERLAAALRLPLSRHEEREFADGEHKSRPLDPVASRRVCIVHSLYGDDGQSVDGKLCRLLFFIAAVRDAGAARIVSGLKEKSE